MLQSSTLIALSMVTSTFPIYTWLCQRRTRTRVDCRVFRIPLLPRARSNGIDGSEGYHVAVCFIASASAHSAGHSSLESRHGLRLSSGLPRWSRSGPAARAWGRSVMPRPTASA